MRLTTHCGRLEKLGYVMPTSATLLTLKKGDGQVTGQKLTTLGADSFYDDVYPLTTSTSSLISPKIT